MARANPRVLPGYRLSLSFTLVYLSVLVILPLGACVVTATGLTWEQFLAAVWTERARAAYALTFGASFVAARDQSRPRPAHRLGAGALRVPRQAALRLARRSAVRAADGGGRAGVLEPVRRQRLARAVPRAAGHRGGVLAARRSCWCWCSSASRSSCGRCSRCSRASTPRRKRRPGCSARSRWQTFRRDHVPGAAARPADRLRAGVRPRPGRIRLGGVRLRATCRSRPRSRRS